MLKKQTPLPITEMPAEVRMTGKRLWKWLEDRRERGIPEAGLPAPRVCDEGCTLHDHRE